MAFLSTPSGWRATGNNPARTRGRTISIHALRVEGDWITMIRTFLPRPISIHALRVEGDHLDKEQYMRQTISIHALRVEGDD